MLRFRVPVAEWADRLPRSEATKALILETVDRAPEARDVRAGSSRSFSQRPRPPSSADGSRRTRKDGESRRWRSMPLPSGARRPSQPRKVRRSCGPRSRSRVSGLARVIPIEPTSSFARRSRSSKRGAFASEYSLELLCLIGDEYRRRRQHAMAQGLYSEALAMSSYYAPAYLGLARNYRDARRPRERPPRARGAPSDSIPRTTRPRKISRSSRSSRPGGARVVGLVSVRRGRARRRHRVGCRRL